MYHFLSGYTAKVAGTERGLGTEPSTTFSTCFGAPFMTLPPRRYADLLGAKLRRHRADVWLLNTGWTGGGYGQGKRISLPHTRALVDAIMNGSLADASYATDPIFGLEYPVSCPGVPPEILNPRNTWPDPLAYDAQAARLADAVPRELRALPGRRPGDQGSGTEGVDLKSEISNLKSPARPPLRATPAGRRRC